MLTSMAANISTIGRAAILGFVAELGDKTFFLTVILAAWCPVAGIRSKSGAVWQQFLVVAGTTSALSLHAAFSVIFPGFVGSDRSFMDWTLGSLAVACQGALGLQALLQLRKVDAKRRGSAAFGNPVSSRPGIAAQVKTPSKEPQADAFQPSTFLGTFKAYNPEEYEPTKDESGVRGAPPFAAETGATDPSKQNSDSANPFEEEAGASYGTITAPHVLQKASNPVASSAAAFVLSFVAILLAEAGDKSLEALRAAQPNAIIGSGAVGGYMVCSMFAVIIGFVLERQLTERRLLFAVAGGLWTMVLVTSSQVLLHAYGNYLLRKPVSAPNVNAKGDLRMTSLLQRRKA